MGVKAVATVGQYFRVVIAKNDPNVPGRGYKLIELRGDDIDRGSHWNWMIRGLSKCGRQSDTNQSGTKRSA